MAINHGSLRAKLTPRGVVGGRVQNSTLAYENDYGNLINKPSINGTEVDGDLSLEDLGIVNNVQPDWEQDDIEAEDYIKNKPTIPKNLSDLNDDATHRTVTDAEKTEWNNKSDFSGSYNDLTDKPVIPDAQIQSDWNQNDSSKLDYIKNRPTIPSAQVQSDWNESDSSKADFIKNKPTIPAEQVNSDWNAESGKAQILNKPSIPTALADLTDDSTHRTVTDTEKTAWNSGEANVQSNWNETDTTSDAYIQNKPSIPSIEANPGSTTANLTSIGIDGTNYAIQGGGGGAVDSVNGKTGVVVLVATDVGALPDSTPLFSGDYNDLSNKPTIPDDLADLNDDSTHRLVTDTEKTNWNGKSDFSGSYNDLSDKPTIPSALADLTDDTTHRVVTDSEKTTWNGKSDFSGSYNDLTDKPTIPDVSGKADKVTSATSGNLAGLNSSGNLTDSGWNGAKDTTSISGNPISISGLKTNQLAIDPIITLEPIQAGSGDPSPINERPISGYDKVEVFSCGKNIFNPEYLLTRSGWYKDANNVYNGLNSALNQYLYPELIFEPNTQYTFSAKFRSDAASSTWFFFLYTDGTNKYISVSDTSETLITLTSDAGKSISHMTFSYGSSTTIHLSEIQLEKSASVTTYEPHHKATSISESLGQTVYHAIDNVREGKLDIDSADYVLTGNETWTGVWSNTVYYTSLPKTAKSGNNTINLFACEFAKPTSLNQLYRGATGIAVDNNTSVYISADIYASISSLTGKKLVYELADSAKFTIQLTPHEISLLKDYAYVSTNGTSMSFSYHNGEIASLADVSQLGETVNELGSEVSEVKSTVNAYRFGRRSNLSQTNANNKFICPCDGYVRLYSEISAPLTVFISDELGRTDSDYIISVGFTGANTAVSVTYVKKGMRIWINPNTPFTSPGHLAMFHPIM